MLDPVPGGDQCQRAGAGAALRSIAVFHDAELRNVMVELLRQLKARHGSRIHVFVFSEAGKRFYTDQPDAAELFDSIESVPIISTGSVAPLRHRIDEIAVEARAYEARLGVPYNQVMMTDRHVGRGFSPGGYYHPRSLQSESTDYWQIVQHLNEQFGFWFEQFEKRQFTLVLNLQKIPSMVAEHLGVPCRQLTQARIENLFYWSRNVHLETPDIEAAFHRLAENEAEPPQIVSYDQYGTNRAIALRAFRLSSALRGAVRTTWRYALRRLRGQRGGYRWSDNVRSNLRYWTQWRMLNRLPLTSLEDLKERDYVFFAL